VIRGVEVRRHCVDVRKRFVEQHQDVADANAASGTTWVRASDGAPEVEWTFGYPAVVLGMLSVTIVRVGDFRREGWL
jgi:hypothetical protein